MKWHNSDGRAEKCYTPYSCKQTNHWDTFAEAQSHHEWSQEPAVGSMVMGTTGPGVNLGGGMVLGFDGQVGLKF